MSKSKSSVKRYVITSYIVFWIMVLGLCGGASMIFHASPFVMRVLSNVCAWSPTIVVLAIWHKLRPEQSRKSFIKESFSGRIKAGLLIIPPVLLVVSNLACVYILSLFQGKDFSTYFSMNGYSLLASILFCVTTGPTGEELGWRGYLRCELNNKYTFVKSVIYQGLIWAFWHAVLWGVDSDYMDLRMILYIISNIVVMTCITLVMNVVLEKENNLFYAIVIHFAFNFTYCFLNIDIYYYIILCVIYVILALGFLKYRSVSKYQNISRQ